MITTTGGRLCLVTGVVGRVTGMIIGGGAVVVDTVGVRSCRLRLLVNSIFCNRLLGLQL